MKTDAILSKREREVMNLVVLGYSAREIAERMNVIYQCVANHLQSIYDKTGTKRTLQALVTWYFTQNFGITLNVSEMTRRVGAAVLLCLFSVEVFSTDFECRGLRNPPPKPRLLGGRADRKLTNKECVAGWQCLRITNGRRCEAKYHLRRLESCRTLKIAARKG